MKYTLAMLVGGLLMGPAMHAAKAQEQVQEDDGMTDRAKVSQSKVLPTDKILPTSPAVADARDDVEQKAASDDDAKPTVWELAAPRTVLLDLDGYMRLRGNMLHNADLKNGTTPIQRSPSDKDSFTSWDMRLRLEPVVNVTENMRISGTMDVFDNLVFGSTPAMQGFNQDGQGVQEPLSILHNSQGIVENGYESLRDSIAMKRLWLETDLFDNRVRVLAGRMPAHFGLGMYYNNGNCLDCDYSDAVDRIQIAVQLGDLTIAPAYDLYTTGFLRQVHSGQGRIFDYDNVDDGFELSCQVSQKDSAQDVEQKLLKSDYVFNFAVNPMFRRQSRGAIYQNGVYLDGSLFDDTTTAEQAFYRMNAKLYGIDAWAALYTEEISLEAEGLVLYASMLDQDGTELSALQYGFAFEGRYRPKKLANKMTLTLYAGLASGDKSQGFGTFANQAGQADDDDAINNFQFNPSYQIDMMLFRYLVGTVTDAFYMKPALSYLFANNIGGSVSALYGQAVYANSTASGSNAPLGIELNAKLFFRSDGVMGVEGFDFPWGRSPLRLNSEIRAAPVKGGLMGSLSYGLLFPLKAWVNPDLPEDEQDPSTMVHAVMAKLAIVF